MGKSRAAVANAMRLLALEPEIRRSLVAGEVSEGHARALLALPEARARIAAWQEVVRKRLSVRETEAFVRKALAASSDAAGATRPGARTARRDASYGDVESQLRRRLSTRVTVVPQRKGARITIDCYSTEEFDNVVALLLEEDA